MPTSVLTVTQVNQNFSRARKAVENGPVIITDRGEPAMVLMSYETYQSRDKASSQQSLFERLHVPGVEDIELELPERQVDPFPRPNQGLDWLDD
jgi:prevent-host-death family protein